MECEKRTGGFSVIRLQLGNVQSDEPCQSDGESCQEPRKRRLNWGGDRNRTLSKHRGGQVKLKSKVKAKRRK